VNVWALGATKALEKQPLGRNDQMESSALEFTILRLLDLHETKGSATCLQDVDIASATGATIGEVRKRLEHLKTRELVELVNASGASYAAVLRYHRPRLRRLVVA
jgi:hypothetical protein